MSWLASFFASAWSRIAAVAGIVGAAALVLFRIFRAGAASEQAKSTAAALAHQTATAQQVSKSDEAMADPAAERARRVRRQFERDD
jgi:hypothetical protein